IVVIDEPSELDKAASDLYGYLNRRFSEADENGELGLKPEALFLSEAELYDRLTSQGRVDLRLLGRIAGQTDEQFRIESVPLPDTVPIDARQAENSSPPQSPWKGDQRRNLFLFPVSDQTPELQMFSQAPRRYHGRINELAADLAAREAR